MDSESRTTPYHPQAQPDPTAAVYTVVPVDGSCPPKEHSPDGAAALWPGAVFAGRAGGSGRCSLGGGRRPRWKKKGSCSCEQYPEEWDEELSEPELQRPPESEQSEKEETVQSPLLEEGSIEEEPELQGPPESEQSEKEEASSVPAARRVGSIEGGTRAERGWGELSEPVLQESSESGQSEEDRGQISPQSSCGRTTRTTAGIHSNPFDLPRSAVRKVGGGAEAQVVAHTNHLCLIALRDIISTLVGKLP
ncbi:unnamed protein product [Boreogadus saida]